MEETKTPTNDLTAMSDRINRLPLNSKLGRAEIRSWMLMPKDIPAVDCQSSNVKAYGWDEKSETLKVVFVNGTEYRYLGVSPRVHADLEKAPSKGGVLSMVKQMFTAVKIEPVFYV